jgi:putative restriction endonuclease
MNLFVGVTDNGWFDFLRSARPAEVNFWRPGGTAFRALQPGEPFLFKLKAPRSAIAGGGFFVRFTRLPLTLMWDVFGLKNGSPDFRSLAAKIRELRSDSDVNPPIGCVVLTSPFFFQEENWIPVPDSFSHNIVSGKTYDVTTDGRELWEQVRTRLQEMEDAGGAGSKDGDRHVVAPGRVAEDLARYGAPYVARNRLGQSGFRTVVTDAYDRRCAFTGEKTLPALQASHIKPYASSGPHRVDNGLLLRADLHQLFDAGYLTITRDHRIEVSRRIAEEFDNGKEYYAMHGQGLQVLPPDASDRPSQSFVDYHNDAIYVG